MIQHQDVRELTPAELDAVSGGVLPVLVAAAAIAPLAVGVATWL